MSASDNNRVPNDTDDYPTQGTREDNEPANNYGMEKLTVQVRQMENPKSNSKQNSKQSELASIRARMMAPTSGADLRTMLDGRTNIRLYKDLSNFATIDDLLGEHGNCIFLYPFTPEDPSTGHWCCIFRSPGKKLIEYFDSYGAFIDKPLGWESEWKDCIRHPVKIPPYLSKLLREANPKDILWYNETPFQSTKMATQTCGLWCVFRLKNSDLSEDEFCKRFFAEPLAKRVAPDLLVAGLAQQLWPQIPVIAE